MDFGKYRTSFPEIDTKKLSKKLQNIDHETDDRTASSPLENPMFLDNDNGNAVKPKQYYLFGKRPHQAMNFHHKEVY